LTLIFVQHYTHDVPEPTTTSPLVSISVLSTGENLSFSIKNIISNLVCPTDLQHFSPYQRLEGYKPTIFFISAQVNVQVTTGIRSTNATTQPSKSVY